MMTDDLCHIESENLAQKTYWRIFNLTVLSNRSRSHVYNGVSIAFRNKSDLCHNGSTSMMYKVLTTSHLGHHLSHVGVDQLACPLSVETS